MLGIFGVPTDRKTARVVLIPAPWDVTTSYGGGTDKGPEAILQASPQIDLYDIEFGEAWKKGYHMEKPDPIFQKNESLRKTAKKVIDEWDELGQNTSATKKHVDEVNAATAQMVRAVEATATEILDEGKIAALVGGDHSTPLGLIRAVGKKYKGDYGVLHIDAHADFRNAYHGFTHSHASIMYNVMEMEHAPKKMVQVGVRDFCKEEFDYIQSNDRVKTFFDREMKSEMLAGKVWNQFCEQILLELPENVYISFDIDGLSPEFCPHTGTPVPGGLSFDQVIHLIGAVGRSGKRIVGFDLNEVAPGSDTEWDGNVGSRILFKLCGWAVTSNEK